MQSNNAGFTVRMFASITDLLIELVLFLFGLYAFVMMLSVDNFVSSSVNLIMYLISFLLFFGILRLFYSIYFISNYGGTIGKLVFNLIIVDVNSGELLDKKRAFYRLLVGYAFSLQFFGWGFLRIIKNPNKFAWHDELFNTKVVDKGSAFTGGMILIALLLMIGLLTFKTYSTFKSSEYLDYLIKLFPEATTQRKIDQNVVDDIDRRNDTIGIY